MLQHRLVAHRGFQKRYPENTLLAMTKAIEAGARLIEMDIQFTADEQPVVYHDLMMKRVSNRESIIASLSFEQAVLCPAYEPGRLGDVFINETITPLTHIVSLLQQNPEVTAFIELKKEAVELLGVEKAYQCIKPLLKPVQGQCVLISFHQAFISLAQSKADFRTGLVAKTWQDVHREASVKQPLDYVFCDKNQVPETAELMGLPFLLVIYEIGDALEARQWFDRGADMVETFDIGTLLSTLAHQAL